MVMVMYCLSNVVHYNYRMIPTHSKTIPAEILNMMIPSHPNTHHSMIIQPNTLTVQHGPDLSLWVITSTKI